MCSRPDRSCAPRHCHRSSSHTPTEWRIRSSGSSAADSTIVGPDGRYVVEPVFEQPLIMLADLDLDRTREERMTLDVAGHYARNDVLSLAVHRSGRLSESATI